MNHLIKKAKEKAANCMDIDFCLDQYYKYSRLSTNSNVFSPSGSVFVEICNIWYDKYMELVHK